jgi:hypothetical protein
LRGGILNIVRKYISLNGIPKNIPEYLEIDIAGFEIGRNVHINDIVLSEDVAPVDKNNFTILTIAGRVEEKEEEQEVMTVLIRDPKIHSECKGNRLYKNKKNGGIEGRSQK